MWYPTHVVAIRIAASDFQNAHDRQEIRLCYRSVCRIANTSTHTRAAVDCQWTVFASILLVATNKLEPAHSLLDYVVHRYPATRTWSYTILEGCAWRRSATPCVRHHKGRVHLLTACHVHHDARPPLSVHVHRLVIRAAQHAAQNQLPHSHWPFPAIRRRAIGGRGRWKDATGVGTAAEVDSVRRKVHASPIPTNALPTQGQRKRQSRHLCTE